MFDSGILNHRMHVPLFLQPSTKKLGYNSKSCANKCCHDVIHYAFTSSTTAAEDVTDCIIACHLNMCYAPVIQSVINPHILKVILLTFALEGGGGKTTPGVSQLLD